MKKTWTAAVLSSVLVLGLASSALAVHATETVEPPSVAKSASKVTISGSVRERGHYDMDNSNKHTVGRTGYDSRVKLGVAGQVDKNSRPYFRYFRLEERRQRHQRR